MTTNKEFLTIEQFAERMQISRSTAYNWVATGRLKAGAHVIRLGNVVRIIWCDELLNHLLMLSASEDDKSGKSVLKRKGTGGRNRVALDIKQFDDI